MIELIKSQSATQLSIAGNASSVCKLRAYCHANHLRTHPKREMIVATLQWLPDGATADQLWEQIYQRGPKMSFAGLYNSLNWLIAKGFVEKDSQGRQRTIYRTRW